MTKNVSFSFFLLFLSSLVVVLSISPLILLLLLSSLVMFMLMSESSRLAMASSLFLFLVTKRRISLWSRMSRASSNSLGKRQWSVSRSGLAFDSWVGGRDDRGFWYLVWLWLGWYVSSSLLGLYLDSCAIRRSTN